VHEPEEKAPFGKYAKAPQAGWAEQGSGILRAGEGQRGQTWARPLEEFKWKMDFLNFN
jgi:hypothetical protein